MIKLNNTGILVFVSLAIIILMLDAAAATSSPTQQQQQQQQQPKLRAKRTLDDVGILMENDDMMAFLVCEICSKESCQKDYCKFCTECNAPKQQLKQQQHNDHNRHQSKQSSPNTNDNFLFDALSLDKRVPHVCKNCVRYRAKSHRTINKFAK